MNSPFPHGEQQKELRTGTTGKDESKQSFNSPGSPTTQAVGANLWKKRKHAQHMLQQK